MYNMYILKIMKIRHPAVADSDQVMASYFLVFYRLYSNKHFMKVMPVLYF